MKVEPAQTRAVPSAPTEKSGSIGGPAHSLAGLRACPLPWGLKAFFDMGNASHHILMLEQWGV